MAAMAAVAEIDRLVLPATVDAAALWPAAAAALTRWLDTRAIAARDAVVLLPFAALLPLLRSALAAGGGWQPRVETPLTLAATLGPPPALEPGRCSGDPLLDRLGALRLLRQQPWTQEWQQGDGAGLEPLLALLVDAAQRLRAGAHAQPPALRAAWWATLHERLGGPATAIEARLLRLAADWAQGGTGAATDALFTLRPAAWIAVRIGGADPLTQALLDAADTPALWLDADPDPQSPFAPFAPFAAAATPGRVRRWLCADAEAEARAAASEVIDALNAGRGPVALVALDRARVRRVRALLERRGVPLVDETGWRLSTTRAASRLLGGLQAAAPGAGRDALLGWLATWPGATQAALVSLEALWRGRRRVPDRPAAERLWRAAQAHLAPWADSSATPGQPAGRRSLGDWLALLDASLRADGSLDEFEADAAGRQVLAALRLGDTAQAQAQAQGQAQGQAPAASAWQQVAAQTPFDLVEFSAWVASTLDGAPYLPPVPPAAAGAAVVLTPLARAIGRPFGQIVLPGADHRQLGAVAQPPTLLSETLAAEIGLETAQQRRQRQRLALAQLLRAPALTLLRSAQDAGEPLAESPDVEWLQLERRRAGVAGWPLQPAAPLTRELAPQPVLPPLPAAARALPTALSATAVQALRDCPYRFYARSVLRLDEPAELELALAKRDYGEWLHLVLHRFHRERADAQRAGAAPGDDRARLEAAADWATSEQQLDEGELLPYRASFEAFAPAYLAWLARREAAGWHWLDGEVDRSSEPPALAPTGLRGRIDRIDRLDRLGPGPGGTLQVLDYKTGSDSALKKAVKQPLEDTQLAFYAALLGVHDAGDAGEAGEAGNAPPPDVRAAYLALDGADAPVEIEHRDVQRSATVLVQGLGGELQRLRAGAPLPALGEGRVCEYCEARGLCRRDHWVQPA